VVFFFFFFFFFFEMGAIGTENAFLTDDANEWDRKCFFDR
jgi:hypothetical protein